MSIARLLAVSYRRVRSFSRHFITIQSRSPLSDWPSFFGSMARRCCAVREPVLPRDESRVDGLCGSTSRMIRIISAKPLLVSSRVSNGVVPVSSS